MTHSLIETWCNGDDCQYIVQHIVKLNDKDACFLINVNDSDDAKEASLPPNIVAFFAPYSDMRYHKDGKIDACCIDVGGMGAHVSIGANRSGSLNSITAKWTDRGWVMIDAFNYIS